MKSINPTHFERVPTFSSNGDERFLHAVIETPRNTRLKFAFEPEFGLFKLKQVLSDGMLWPYDYGFIPRTLAEDGDPLDALVLTDVPTFPGCLIECRILGVVRLVKDDCENDRILAAPQRLAGVAQNADGFDDLGDIPQETVDGICRFLVEYSAEQGHQIQLKGVKGKKPAMSVIDDAMKAYEREKRSNRRHA